MKKYFSRLLIILLACTSISTKSYSATNQDLLELYKLKMYQNMLEKYGELNKKDKKDDKKSETFYQKTLKQTSTLTKKVFYPLLPYAALVTIGSLTANNLAYNFLPSWLVTVRPYSLGDIILSPQGLALMFLLAQDDEKK